MYNDDTYKHGRASDCRFDASAKDPINFVPTKNSPRKGCFYMQSKDYQLR